MGRSALHSSYMSSSNAQLAMSRQNIKAKYPVTSWPASMRLVIEPEKLVKAFSQYDSRCHLQYGAQTAHPRPSLAKV